MKKQPWFGNPITESLFILLPPFFCLLIILLFPGAFQNTPEMTLTGWVILVLLIDVGHVYTTLYRTYFDRQALRKQRNILLMIPFVAFVAGVLVYSVSSTWFWRILAYVAVFHFIRQQYGFMRLYSRKEPKKSFSAQLDKIVIYMAGLYPVLYWHLKGPRNFNWFIENDFYYLPSASILNILTGTYFIILAIYLLYQIYIVIKDRYFNIPKTAIITGTLASWYFGIVYFNGDMAFTLLNVVSHGIPYMALVWLHGKKKQPAIDKQNRFLQIVFSRNGIWLFLLIIFLFAFIEESLWDITVWKEHKSIFGTAGLPNITLNDKLLSLIVPLLSLPQVTHYILDGFIWKINKDEIKWNNEITKDVATA